jgi:hypothetical protein
MSSLVAVDASEWRILAERAERGHTCIMSAQRALRTDELDDAEMLDADTSAAVIRWLETARVPDGVDPERWRVGGWNP